MTRPNNFFKLSEFKLKEIFEGVENVWEVIPKIKEYTSGKLIQGENCKIANSSHIREGVILGDNVIIGHCVELKNCIVMNNSAVAHLNYLGDSIVGNGVNISGGAILANYRLDRNKVSVKINNELIDTGLKKFGAIIGDRSIIGVNAVLNPGTALGKNCIVYPLTSVRGFYKANSTIK
jgi:UDP-N-acetylglucosamine diphosphorylase / glucose-1-phosphate thymidylyltransferase / UDP-N-acetylgalactosamine diphosphorylase / glucosamine-1-phosphate N-acetyltransferase / galactosamine-1-phosphate N-acetyltransferase